MKFIIAIVLLLVVTPISSAGVIVIEPDDYAHGTEITNISKFVKISSTDGSPVFANALSTDAADGYDTKALGKHVFGNEWVRNTHSSYSAFEITFNVPVTSFSLLIAELFHDAGPGSDPVIAYIYNNKNELISEQYVDEFYKRTELGLIRGYEEINLSWAYWTFEFNALDIGKIIIAGDSEPTTFDRLEFTYSELSEPSNPMVAIFILIALLFTHKVKRDRFNLIR